MDRLTGHGRFLIPRAGITHLVSVGFPAIASPDNPPSDEHVAELTQILDDLDGLFDLSRREVAAEYEHWVNKPLPLDWRQAFRIDSIDLADPYEEDSTLDVYYWCEEALHWFVVHLKGTTVIDVAVEG